jgi:cell division protein FtsI (penicillin-binding protein 3)
MIERRLLWLAGIVFAWGSAILFKLIHYQLFRFREFREAARRRQELVVEVPAARGPITDRHGSPLALSVPTESVFVNPLRVPDLEVASEILPACLA